MRTVLRPIFLLLSLTGTMTDAIRLRLMGNSSRDESKDLRTELSVAALA